MTPAEQRPVVARTPVVADMVLQPVAEDVRAARAFTMTQLTPYVADDEQGEDFLAEAAIVISEFATNALDAGAVAIRLHLRIDASGVVISLIDDARRAIAHLGPRPAGCPWPRSAHGRPHRSAVGRGGRSCRQTGVGGTRLPAMTAASDPVLVMSGDVDVASEQTWRRACDEFLGAHPALRNVTVDMAQVDFIDSRGMAVLVALHTSALDRGGKLTLVAVPRRIVTALAVVGLDQVFGIAPA